MSVASKGRNKTLEDKRSHVLAGKPNKREKSGWFRCEFQKLVHLGFENSLRTLPPPSQGLTLGNNCSLWPRGQAHHRWEDHPPPPYRSLDSVASQAPPAKSCVHFQDRACCLWKSIMKGRKADIHFSTLLCSIWMLRAQGQTDRQRGPAQYSCYSSHFQSHQRLVKKS